MSQLTITSGWQEQVTYADDGPHPTILFENDKLKVIAAGLKPGQAIPEHPEALATYHFLAGEGQMVVDGKLFPVQKGATIVTPAGSARGIQATTHLAFLATRIA